MNNMNAFETDDLSEILLSVDGNEPCSALEFLKVNVTDKDVDHLGKSDIISILSLKVGETFYGGLTADVKRIA